MNNGRRNPIFIQKGGSVYSYTRLSNRGDKYKIYLVEKKNDSSDEARRVAFDEENQEKYGEAVNNLTNVKKKSFFEELD